MKTGLALHCHHKLPFEWCHDYDKRVKYITKFKPKNEQKLRLRLFKIIPEDRLPQKGLMTLLKAGETYNKTIETYIKAEETLFKARETWVKAGETYIKVNKEALEKLHEELCPDCPWDGNTIFTRKDKDENWY